VDVLQRRRQDPLLLHDLSQKSCGDVGLGLRAGFLIAAVEVRNMIILAELLCD
jgi:hypothetical protein